MCDGAFGFSEYEINSLYGMIASVIIIIFSIYEFIQLSFDDQHAFIYGIIIVWAISKIVAIIKFLQLKHKQFGFGYYLIAVIFQSEWILNIQTDNNSNYIGIIYQILVNSLPIIITNIYLISDTSRNIDHGYYIAVLFIYYIFIGVAIMVSISQNVQKQYQNGQFYLLLSSIPINFCFWYLFIQSFTFNWIIGVFILIGNFLACIFDLLCLKQKKSSTNNNNNQQIHNILYKILQYQFQFNNYFYSNYPKKSSCVKISSWKKIFPLSIQCLNLTILQIIKFVYYPLIIETDKAFYAFLALSLFQIYLLLLNVFQKLTKQNKYHLNLKFSGEQIQIEKKAYELLPQRFTNDYKVEFEFSLQCLASENQQQFDKILQNMKHFIQEAYQKSNGEREIIIKDINEQIKLSFSFKQSQKRVNQQLGIQNDFFDSNQNQFMLQNLIKVLLNNEFVEFYISSNKIEKVENLMIEIQSFNRNYYNLKNMYSKSLTFSLPFLYTIDQIIGFHHSTMVFGKNISQFLTINPKIVLFDLYEDLN